MPEINGKFYSSKKHPMLEHIFFSKYEPPNSIPVDRISFTLGDISEAYKLLGISEPASISNTILDLTRKDRGITARLPKSIIDLGYDIRKKTGITGDGRSFAGEFVYVGVGNSIQSWLKWPEKFDRELIIPSTAIPDGIKEFIRNDEGALFSIIDYCDVFSIVFHGVPNTIIRIQNPLKWQPNEIDGFYFSNVQGHIQLFPVEAKALTTGDDINLEQIQGALDVISPKYKNRDIVITPLAVKMVRNGILIAEFKSINTLHDNTPIILPYLFYKISFDPVIAAWR